MLHCGMAEVDVTPALGLSIPGYFYDRKATGVKDPLYAKALAVEAEGEAAIVVAIDCIDLPRPVVLAVRERVQRHTGVPDGRILVAATHTHTGPPVMKSTFIGTDDAYMKLLAEKAADAAIMAYNGRREARIGFGSGHEGDIAFNRRFWMKDGRLRTNPGIGNPDIDRAEGPIDPQVLVIRVDDAEGNPIGVVTNYACHTDTVEGTLFSADYPGEMSAALKRSLGDRTVSLFLMGASGNINHFDVTGKLGTDRPGYTGIMGRILAGEVLKTREKCMFVNTLTVGVVQSFFELTLRKPSESDAAEAKRVLESDRESDIERAFADELLAAYASAEHAREIELQAIRLGPMAIFACPGELFAEFGLRLKTESPFAFTLVSELSNGSAIGYICTPEAFMNGGYEPRITSNSRLPERTGDLFVSRGLELLQDLDSKGCEKGV